MTNMLERVIDTPLIINEKSILAFLDRTSWFLFVFNDTIQQVPSLVSGEGSRQGG